MTARPTLSRLLRGLALAAVTTAAITPQLAGHAAGPSPVDDDVSAALSSAWGPGLAVDDSSATRCIGATPQVLAYRDDRIVVRSSLINAAITAEVGQALADLGRSATVASVERITFPPPLSGAPITPVVSVTFVRPSGEPLPIVALARRLHHRGVVDDESPDYALSPSSGPTLMWPAGFPSPAPSLPPTRPSTAGAGVNIVVFDSGLASPTQSLHPANVVRLTSQDVESVDTRPTDGIVDLYFGGHGVAIAGVIATMLPSATVTEARITEANGVATDVSAARRMATSLKNANQANAWPDVIVNAFGSPACDLDPTVPGDELAPVGLEAVSEAVDRHDESMIVAAAGNRSTSRRYYPAAFSTVVSVGALDGNKDGDGNAFTSASRSGPVASFSNYGPWVKAWAPGVHLATTHVNGFRFETTGPMINGIAYVDGTSYAAPIVATLIAEQMATTGQDPQTAWLAVQASGVRCSGLVGGGTAVALTSLASSPTSPATGGTTAAC
jgi:hypothetical protein